MKMKQWFTAVLLFMTAAGPARSAPSLPGFGLAMPLHTRVRLVLEASQVKPGETVLAAFHLSMEPDWHTYWKHGGDSGMPTSIDWTLPDGLKAGAIQWPTPERLVDGGLTTFVYHQEAVLLVPLQVPESATPGELNLRAKVSWLECRVECIPGSQEVQAKLRVGDRRVPSEDAGKFADWKSRLPLSAAEEAVSAQWDGPPREGDLGLDRPLVVTWKAPASARKVDLMTLPWDKTYQVYQVQELPRVDDRVRLRFLARDPKEGWPTRLAGVLAADGGRGVAFEVPIQDPLSSVATSMAQTVEVAPAAEVLPELKSRPLWQYLLLAILAGMILNFMPCVLPVISLKILSFVKQSGEDPKRIRFLGMVYTGGVLASFLALALVVIGFKAAGQSVSWGIQFGNPFFLIGLLVLVTLLALNLFGVFEISIGGKAMGTASELASKEGAPGAFFNGFLATVLATSCSAPVLGGVIGFALAASVPVILLVFLTVGAGMALPYLALSWHPKWLALLPKPGAWMEKFKVGMGFPVLATAVWLLWLAAPHYPGSGVLWLGLFLMVLAFAAWIYGAFVQRGRTHAGLARILAIVLVVGLGYGLLLEGQLNWREPASRAALTGAAPREKDGIPWQPWSTESVAQARKEGHPVFVDFTATWCTTCQLNKKSSIEIPSVRRKLEEIHAVPLLADNTFLPPEIGRELAKYQRGGVPLVLVFPADVSKPAIVLPEILTEGMVLDALDRAAKG